MIQAEDLSDGNVPRETDLNWLVRRIESYHRKRLLAAGVPEDGLRIYKQTGMCGVLETACSNHASLLPPLRENLSAKPEERTAGNMVPPANRQILHRAARLAMTIMFDGALNECNGVTEARTAIFAGWQFMRWEGGRPMEEDTAADKALEHFNEAAAKEVDKIVAETRKKYGKNTPWSRIRTLADYGRISKLMYELFVLRGACGPGTPQSVARAKKLCKLCHYDAPRPKDPQPIVDDTWWRDHHPARW